MENGMRVELLKERRGLGAVEATLLLWVFLEGFEHFDVSYGFNMVLQVD
jgi:hypothetical protein